MKYISFGVNCLPAMLLKNLYLKHETLPFDWCPNTLSVVAHCFKTNFENFYNFDEKLNNLKINKELIEEMRENPSHFYKGTWVNGNT